MGSAKVGIGLSVDTSSKITVKTVASGNPVEFSDGFGGANLRDLSIPFTFTQSGSGTPSMTNVRPIIKNIPENITIVGHGTELWDRQYVKNEAYDDTTGYPIESQSVGRNKNPISVMPGETYYFRDGQAFVRGIYAYDINQTYVGKLAVSKSVAIPNNIYYVNFVLQSYTFASNFYINYPSTVTTKFGFVGNYKKSIPITSDNLYDGTLDIISGEATLNLYSVVIDGVDVEVTSAGSSYGYTYFSTASDHRFPRKSLTTRTDACDKLEVVYNFPSDPKDWCYISNGMSSAYGAVFALGFADQTITTVEQANAYLQENPVTIVYALETPYELSTRNKNAIKSLQGQNYIWNDGNLQLTVKYISSDIIPPVNEIKIGETVTPSDNDGVADITSAVDSEIDNQLQSHNIEDNAEENVIDDIKVNGTSLDPTDKSVDISLINKIKIDDTEVPNDANGVADVTNALNGYVTSRGSIMTSEEKSKLEGIESNAEVNVIDSISFNGTPLTPDDNKNVDIPAELPAATNNELLYSNNNSWVAKNAKDITVGAADNFSNDYPPVIDTTPYNFRRSIYSPRNYMKESGITGATVAWNQMIADDRSHITSTAAASWIDISGLISVVTGHKYLVRLAGNVVDGGKLRMRDAPNEYVYNPERGYQFIYQSTLTTNTMKVQGYWAEGATDAYLNVFDLTLDFGSAIADHAYTLESGTAGAGIAWLKANGFFTKDYYAYNAGSLESVVTSEHITTGFNQWDEEWELGYINLTTGQNANASTTIRSKNYINVLPNTNYYFMCGSVALDCFRICWYDADKNFISSNSNFQDTNVVKKSPANAYFMRFYLANYGTNYNNDICINFSDPSFNGQYVPHRKHSYPLDHTKEWRGVLKLDADNNIYADGDVYAPNGAVTRKRKRVADMSSLTWSRLQYQSSYYYFRCYFADVAQGSANALTTIISPLYLRVRTGTQYLTEDKTITGFSTNHLILVRDDSCQTVEDFLAKVANVPLEFDLAEPTTESAAPYQETQINEIYGTESYTDYAYEQGTRDVEIPVWHTSEYYINLRQKLETQPELPTDLGTGKYLLELEQIGDKTYSKYSKYTIPETGALVLPTANWIRQSGTSNIYYQVVTTQITGITNKSQINLQPDDIIYSQLASDDILSLYVSQNNAVATIYSIGAPISTDITVQYTKIEIA